ncbi:MAG: glutamate--tRNA ligase, partial [Paracoccaceae bacterium]
LDAIAEGFEITRFGAAPTKFDVADLFPLTARYLHGLPFDAVKDRILALGVPEGLAERFWTVTRENITTLADLPGWWAMCRDGAEPVIAPEDAGFVGEAMALLPEPPFTEETWGEWTARVREATGRKGKALFMPLRKALTGMERGPEMADLMPLLQKVRAKG